MLRHELFPSLLEQWVDRLGFLPARQAKVVGRDGRGVSSRTVTIPPHSATGSQVEEIRRESLARYGIPYAEAERNVHQTLVACQQEPSRETEVPA